MSFLFVFCFYFKDEVGQRRVRKSNNFSLGLILVAKDFPGDIFKRLPISQMPFLILNQVKYMII